MNNEENVLKELESLTKEKLIKSYIFQNNKQINIVTLEDLIIDIGINYNYCYCYNGKIYENFEQLLSLNSREYVQRFNQILYKKLSSITN